MRTPYAAAEEYIAALIAADIRATNDPRSVAPPCVLFEPGPVALDTLGGEGVVTMSAILMAPGPGHGAAWRNLEALLAAAIQVLPAESVTPGVYQLNDEQPSLPIYQLQWAEEVDWQLEGNTE